MNQELIAKELISQGAALAATLVEDVVAQAHEILRWARLTFGDQLVVASSMGDEVLVHLASQEAAGVDLLFLDTGYHFAETLGMRHSVTEKYKVKVRTILPLLTIQEQAEQYGTELWARDPDTCCAIRKVEPFERGLRPYAAWVTGMRRVDSSTRTDIEIVGWDARRNKVKINPLAAWSDADIESYVAANGVLQHPLRKIGYTSIGCAPCTRPVETGEDPRAGRWSGTGKTECGLIGEEMFMRSPQPLIEESRVVLPPLSQLDALESESVHIIREVAGSFERPVLLFSGGKDSVVMLHLAAKAFAPANIPFSALHVDTGHNFPEVLRYRDLCVERYGVQLHVALVQGYIDSGRLQERVDGTRNPLQTVPLLEAIAEHHFDAVFGGGRRDEEKARAKERVFSLRDQHGQWDPKRQRPELWDLYNGRHRPGEHLRVFPLSNWTELDIWRYIAREGIEIPAIYFAHQREVFKRNGMWLAPGGWGGPKGGEVLQRITVRYRTVGDMSCTGAVESTASTIDEVIVEIGASKITERGATRADDRLSEAAMEDRKREGYF